MTREEMLLRILEWMIAAIVGVGGYLVSKQVSRSTIKKQDSEGADVIAGAAIELVKPLRDEIKELRDEIRVHQKEITRLQEFERGVYVLIDQMERHGIKPDWTPPENNNAQTRHFKNSL